MKLFKIGSFWSVWFLGNCTWRESRDALAGHELGARDRLALGARQVGAVLRLHAQPVHRGRPDDRVSAGKRETEGLTAVLRTVFYK